MLRKLGCIWDSGYTHGPTKGVGISEMQIVPQLVTCVTVRVWEELESLPQLTCLCGIHCSEDPW